jgi:ABC-2 type transport system permease protein
MRLYIELARRSFQQTITYRAATLAGIFVNGVFGIMVASVYLALYASQGDGGMTAVEGWSRDQTITLVWINQSLLMVVYLWGWWEVTRTIQSGAIATELLKPYDYFSYWLSRDLGRGLAHILLRGVPTFITGFLLFDLLLPETGWRAIGFLLSIPMAITVSFCLRFIANLGGFWVMDYRGLMSIYVATINVLSGMLAPLAFLPGPLRDLANVLPFRAVIMTPNEIYLGQVAIWEGLALQAGWIVALIVAAKVILGIGERRLVVQGG